MLRFAPILFAVAYAIFLYRFSSWRLKQQLDQQSTELAEPRLKPALDALARALDLPRIRVFVYEIEQVNGLAAPDGRIFLTRGFLNKLRTGEVTPEELASVIAHEMGHVALGHSRKRMIDFSGQNALRVILTGVFARILPFIGPLLVNGLMNLLMARLSRNDEYEADAYASALMIKSGLGTAPQISLFHKLEALTGGAGGGTPAWLLSHPKTTERISAIEANEAKWTGA